MLTPTFDELQRRIQREIDHFQGAIPELVALVWDGYLAALIEWELISISGHDRLVEMLPEIPDNPVMAVFLGRPGDNE